MANRDTVLWGRYRLLDVLGDGGMARVFQAEDERLARRVAVKVLHEHYLGQPEFVRRFEQEAQLAAGLTHPNIVAIYDMGRDGDTYFIVMEYVDGGSLKGIIAREAPLPLNRAIAIMRQLGSALDYAHQHGVVHRDIKPENILLSAGHHVKVSDFGIARALTTPGQTATGIVLGSVSYFSPEQAQGQPATAQSDLYSSGVVLYEMLTKRLPFTADTTLSVAMKHITQQPVPPRTYVPQLPQAVDTVVLKALSKHPIDRYVSGNALAEALAAAAASAGRPGTAMPVARAAQMRAAQARTVRVAPVHTPPRRRAPAVALLMLALFGGAGMFAYAHGNDIGYKGADNDTGSHCNDAGFHRHGTGLRGDNAGWRGENTGGHGDRAQSHRRSAHGNTHGAVPYRDTDRLAHTGDTIANPIRDEDAGSYRHGDQDPAAGGP